MKYAQVDDGPVKICESSPNSDAEIYTGMAELINKTVNHLWHCGKVHPGQVSMQLWVGQQI